MLDFSQLKKRGSNLKALQEQLEKSSSSRHVDERIYKPGFDAKSSPAGYAVVRLLPNKFNETYVKTITYSFNGKGGYYGEASPKTESTKNDDPVAMVKAALWNKAQETGDDSYKEKSKKFSRKEDFYCNVYVIKDTIHPENNGKVMIYKFGYSIFKLIASAANPEFEDDEPFDPFDMWNGCDLKIKIKSKSMPDSRNPGKQISVPNYEDSEFSKPSEFFDGDDEKKQELFDQTYELKEFMKFKSFEELAKRFKEVYGEPYTNLAGSKDSIGEEVDALKRALEEHKSTAPVYDDEDVEPTMKASEPEDSDDGVPPFEVDEEPVVENKKEKEETPVAETALERFKRLSAKK